MTTQNQGESKKRGASSRKARVIKNTVQETIGDLLIEVSQL